jgi:pimeloyl-ACP methyl ester carboxylesterase
MYREPPDPAPDPDPAPQPGIGPSLLKAVVETIRDLPFGLPFHIPLGAPWGVPFAVHHKSRGERRAVRMVPAKLVTDGRRMRYSVSDNVNACGPEGPDSPPIWAVNIHGYFAGGTMYWRESANLAEKLGWRLINPTLPGFAGSDPLPWQRVTIGEIADQVLQLMDNLGVQRAVLLGHSMGGAVAVRMASAQPDRVLGIVYRDGAATPEWKQRHSALVRLLSPFVPGPANLLDLTLSVVLDSPDLLIGRRLSSTVRGLWPDAQKNLRDFGKVLPVGSMLMSLDMSEEVSRLHDLDIPVLAEWGCFDRVVTPRCAAEFCELSGCDFVWVPGGHSWMLPRPQGQADIFRYVPAGRNFVERVTGRHATGVDTDLAPATPDGVGLTEPIPLFGRGTAG